MAWLGAGLGTSRVLPVLLRLLLLLLLLLFLLLLFLLLVLLLFCGLLRRAIPVVTARPLGRRLLCRGRRAINSLVPLLCHRAPPLSYWARAAPGPREPRSSTLFCSHRGRRRRAREMDRTQGEIAVWKPSVWLEWLTPSSRRVHAKKQPAAARPTMDTHLLPE